MKIQLKNFFGNFFLQFQKTTKKNFSLEFVHSTKSLQNFFFRKFK